MESPRDGDIDRALARILKDGIVAEPAIVNEPTVLAPEDEEYLRGLLKHLRAGRKAVVIVEDTDERLRYMFCSATRAEAMQMLGKVVEATGKRIQEGDN